MNSANAQLILFICFNRHHPKLLIIIFELLFKALRRPNDLIINYLRTRAPFGSPIAPLKNKFVSFHNNLDNLIRKHLICIFMVISPSFLSFHFFICSLSHSHLKLSSQSIMEIKFSSRKEALRHKQTQSIFFEVNGYECLKLND